MRNFLQKYVSDQGTIGYNLIGDVGKHLDQAETTADANMLAEETRISGLRVENEGVRTASLSASKTKRDDVLSVQEGLVGAAQTVCETWCDERFFFLRLCAPYLNRGEVRSIVST